MSAQRRTSTIRQLEVLLDFMEGHRDLALGRIRSKEARARSVRLWEEAALRLNAEGPPRSGKEWARYWTDLKTRVRGKLCAINASLNATGGGAREVEPLTPIEARVAALIGTDVGPLQGVTYNPLQQNSERVEAVPGPSTSASTEAESQSILINSVVQNVLTDEDAPNTRNSSSNVLEPQHMGSRENHSPSASLDSVPDDQELRRIAELASARRLQRREIRRRERLAAAAAAASGTGRRRGRPTERGASSARRDRARTSAASDSLAFIERIEEMRANSDAQQARAALRNAESFSVFAAAAMTMAEAFDRYTRTLEQERRRENQDE